MNTHDHDPNGGDFAEDAETLARDEHVGSFAKGEETLPHAHVGTFVEGEKMLPSDDRTGTFGDRKDPDPGNTWEATRRPLRW
jgi:hypothetical protein